MKKIWIVLLALGSISAFAKEEFEAFKRDSQDMHSTFNPTSDLNKADRSGLIKNPVDPGTGLPFSAPRIASTDQENWSDENGICIYLGYEKALIGSSKSSGDYNMPNQVRDIVQVYKNGKLIGGKKSYFTLEIRCVNKLKDPTFTSKLYNRKMLDNANGLPFSATRITSTDQENWSDENGICINLGHNRALSRSSRSSEDYRVDNDYGSALQIDQFGEAVQVVKSFKAIQIVCLD